MKIETGLILCAGFGKRLAPLTDKTPKPLLKIKNNVLLDKSINFLEKCGINKIKINTHYLAQEIENFIRAQNYKIKIEISYENEILDTGGGIKNLIKNEVDENFLVLNPDTIWNDKYLDEVVQMKNLFFKNNLNNILLLVKKSNSFDKRFNGDSKKVKKPLPKKYSLIKLRSIVLCLETSINPHKNQNGNIAHIPIFIKRKIVLRIKGISKINLKTISITNYN